MYEALSCPHGHHIWNHLQAFIRIHMHNCSIIVNKILVLIINDDLENYMDILHVLYKL